MSSLFYDYVLYLVKYRSKPLQRDQAKELLAVIKKGGTSAFDKFVEVLLGSDTMSFLGKRLRKETLEDDKQYGKPAALTACANVPACALCLPSDMMLCMHNVIVF